MMNMRIVPAVKRIKHLGEKLNVREVKCFEELTEFERELLRGHLNQESGFQLRFLTDGSLPEQAYRLTVDSREAKIASSSASGRQYGLTTFVQLLKQQDVRKLEIYDEPDFPIRSVMIDISRNKVPKLETLCAIVDQLALAKVNDLQLYVEGRSFYFESFPGYYENKEDFLTGEEVLKLREYCEKRGISLTPNMNCFGHMAYWLNQDEFRHLALNRDFRWSENGLRGYPGTLDPFNPEAKEFVYALFSDMLKYYPDSKYFTIGGDEPFELLFPEKHPDAERIYAEYMREIVSHVRSMGVVPLMWGDVAKRKPEFFEYFGETVFLEWGYHPGDFSDENCGLYRKHGKDFIVACGTSLWNSIAGRSKVMLENCREASFYGKKHGAKGLMITDWGDGGSLQQFPSSLLAYWIGAAHAWNSENVVLADLFAELDENLFRNPLSEALFELGNYSECQDERLFNLTKLFVAFYVHQLDGIKVDIGDYSDPTAMFASDKILNARELSKTEEFLVSWQDRLGKTSGRRIHSGNALHLPSAQPRLEVKQSLFEIEEHRCESGRGAGADIRHRFLDLRIQGNLVPPEQKKRLQILRREDADFA